MGKGKGRKTVYFLFYCKFLDLLLTTFRVFFLWGEDIVGTEKKEIYILYINIYVNCIVLLYRRWHCCLFIPFPHPALGCGSSGHTAQLSRTQDCSPSPPALCLETAPCVYVDGSPLILQTPSVPSWWSRVPPYAIATKADKPVTVGLLKGGWVGGEMGVALEGGQ